MKKIKDSISLVRIRKFVRDSEWIAPPLIFFPIRSLLRLKSINVEFHFKKIMFRDNRIKEGKVNNLSLLRR